MNCRKFAVTALGIEGSKLKIKTYFLPCNSWSCPECAKRKARRVAKTTKKGLEGETIRFVTLTMCPSKNLTESARNIKEAWNRLRLAITRRFGTFKYVWTIEGHKSTGMPHLHILLNKYIPQKWLSRSAYRAGFGYVADIRKVKTNDAFDYVVKYLGKGLGSKTLERIMKEQRLRRWSKSRSIKTDEKDNKGFAAVRISDIIAPLDFYASQQSRNQERNEVKEEDYEEDNNSFTLTYDVGGEASNILKAINLYKNKEIDVGELVGSSPEYMVFANPPPGGWSPWDRRDF